MPVPFSSRHGSVRADLQHPVVHAIGDIDRPVVKQDAMRDHPDYCRNEKTPTENTKTTGRQSQ